MARRKRVEGHVNHERWLVSYADFITLLFAFFVVMYSVSTINEDKYRVLSDSMVSAFQTPVSSMEPIQVGQLVRSPQAPPQKINDVSGVARPEMAMELQNNPEQKAVSEESDKSFTQQVLDKAEAEVNTIAEDVEERLGETIEEGIIDIKRNKFWLEVEIKSSLLFPSGSSSLIPESIPLLIELSASFVDLPNRIHIEGFTDDKPINTEVFPSNWELSGARAAAVVRLFERNDIEPSRLAAIGYGEYHPISGNQNEEERAKNRRVVIVVMASIEGRQNERLYEFELLKGTSASSVASP